MKESIKKFWHENWYDIVGTGLKILGWGGMIAAAYFGAKKGVSSMTVDLHSNVYLGQDPIKRVLFHLNGMGTCEGKEEVLPPIDTDPIAEELDHLDDKKEEEE